MQYTGPASVPVPAVISRPKGGSTSVRKIPRPSASRSHPPSRRGVVGLKVDAEREPRALLPPNPASKALGNGDRFDTVGLTCAVRLEHGRGHHSRPAADCRVALVARDAGRDTRPRWCSQPGPAQGAHSGHLLTRPHAHHRDLTLKDKKPARNPMSGPVRAVTRYPTSSPVELCRCRATFR
jgi:hypothetical protein